MKPATKIKPKEIVIKEEYIYQAGISKNDYIKMVSDPLGKIKIQVPYDGERYFPMQSSNALMSEKDLDHLRIGWLAVGEPKDWEGNWLQKVGADVLDVNIPLRTDEINEEDWTADEFSALFLHDYFLERPRYYPISIDLEVRDYAAISPFMVSRDLRKLAKDDDFWKLLFEKSSEIYQGNNLSFEIVIQISLPTVLVNKDISVGLEKLILIWPKFPPKEQFQIWQLDTKKGNWKNVDWVYEPDRNEIVLAYLEMNQVGSKNGSPLTKYWSIIRVDLMFASGDLIKEDKIDGKAIIKVENALLSGRDVAWINLDGQKDKAANVKKQTVIDASFKAFLSDRFANKQSFISRAWRFPGVSLTPSRIVDIVSILQDQGYSIIYPDIINNDENQDTQKEKETERGHIVGRRLVIESEQDPYELKVFIDVRGTALTTTKRERRIAEEETFITEIPTQELLINYFAQINGPGRIVALDADNIMLRLKEQFSTVADLR